VEESEAVCVPASSVTVTAPVTVTGWTTGVGELEESMEIVQEDCAASDVPQLLTAMVK
jgi:hypothetical protein